MANQHGGARPGAGRKPGSKTRRVQEIAAQAAQAGITPLEYMLAILRDEAHDTATRMDAAKSAAPYIHPKLSTVEMTGADGGPLQVQEVRLTALSGNG